MQIAGVKINENKRVKYYYYDNLNLKKNLTVIVDTEVGLQFARVYSIIDKELDESQIEKGKIVRITTKKDYVRYLANLKDAKTALKKCRELVKKLKLNMYIIDAEYTFTRNQLIYHFIADDRVDFRQLAKDLGSFYKTRIELRQIGIRDKAKEIGGVGLCGRRLCCSLFLNEFDSVSINMAKNQSLSLNPSKINGACSRLLCCLKYENENCFFRHRWNAARYRGKETFRKNAGGAFQTEEERREALHRDRTCSSFPSGICKNIQLRCFHDFQRLLLF